MLKRAKSTSSRAVFSKLARSSSVIRFATPPGTPKVGCTLRPPSAPMMSIALPRAWITAVPVSTPTLWIRPRMLRSAGGASGPRTKSGAARM